MEALMEARRVNGMGFSVASWPLNPEQSTIVLIHGAGGSGSFWQQQIIGLAEKANTVALDLPGHGESDGNGYDKIENYAGAVIDFINAIEAPNPILCGFSMGGAICLQIMLDCPDLARAGILVCSGATIKVGRAIFDSIENDYNGFVDFISKIAASKKTDRHILRRFIEDLSRTKSRTTYNDFRACNDFDVSSNLSSITTPVLVITTEEDRLTPPQYGEFLVKGIENATRAHIKNAGHIVALEQSDEVNAAILNFLAQTGP
jgi:pimeloyl-ACP methyl ester carboxylesterase